MREEELDDFDEEEFEMLINGLIHPGDMMLSPDLLAGAYPSPIGGTPQMPADMPQPGFPGGPGMGPLDDMIAQAYDELED